MKANNIFPKFRIEPISLINEGLKLGNFESTEGDGKLNIYQKQSLEEVKKVKLFNIQWIKDVCLFYSPLKDQYADSIKEVVEHMKEYGLKPCDYAPNYLLGLMAKVSEKDWPEELEKLTGNTVHNIIAFDPHNPWSSFRCESMGQPRFLEATRYIKNDDKPRLRTLSSIGCGNNRWFYKPESLGRQLMLAEKI